MKYFKVYIIIITIRLFSFHCGVILTFITSNRDTNYQTSEQTGTSFALSISHSPESNKMKSGVSLDVLLCSNLYPFCFVR